MLQRVHFVLCNDRQTKKYTLAVTEQRLRKQACFYYNERVQQQRIYFLRGPFPVSILEIPHLFKLILIFELYWRVL